MAEIEELTKCTCGGSITANTWPFCPECSTDFRDTVEDIEPKTLAPAEIKAIADKYDLPEDLVVQIGDSGLSNCLSDNMVIYDDGVIDPYDNADELIGAIISDDMHWSIKQAVAIFINGVKQEFDIVKRVSFIKSKRRFKIKKYVAPEELERHDYILLFDGVSTDHEWYNDMKSMATFVEESAGFNIVKAIIKRNPYDYITETIIRFPRKGKEFVIETETSNE